MSGWIKMSVSLRTHPKVVRMASALKTDRLRVIGGLHAVWCVFDAHTEDGMLEGYTLDAIDTDLGWRGFGAAMQAIGWLIESDSGLHAPEYETHNGATAKRRAMETSRKGNARKKSAIDPHDDQPQIGQLSACDADKLRNREEKRREEEKTRLSDGLQLAASAQAPTPPPPFLGDANSSELNGRHVVALAASWELPEAWGVDAEALGWKPAEVLKESERFRQYWTAGKGSATRRSVKGWRQSWSNWLSKAERYAR